VHCYGLNSIRSFVLEIEIEIEIEIGSGISGGSSAKSGLREMWSAAVSAALDSEAWSVTAAGKGASERFPPTDPETPSVTRPVIGGIGPEIRLFRHFFLANSRAGEKLRLYPKNRL